MTNVSIYKSVNHSGDVSGPSVGTFRFRRGGEDGKFFYNTEAVILSGGPGGGISAFGLCISGTVLIPISYLYSTVWEFAPCQ